MRRPFAIAALLLAAGGARALAQSSAAPDSADAARRAAWVDTLIRRERWAEAVTAIAPLAARDPGAARVASRLRVNAGVAAYRRGDRPAARDYWTQALRDDPALLEAAVDLAGLLLEAGDADTAALVAERGLERHPQSGELWSLAGEAHAAQRDWRGAAVAYRRAAGLLPRPEEAELPLADAYAASGDTGAAVAVLRQMRARPAGHAALLDAAERAVALGAAPLADSCLSALIDRGPDDATALERAAALSLGRGDTARAIGLYRRAAGLDSSGPAAPLALLRLERPGADSATALLRRALWRGAEALQGAELGAAAALGGGLSPRRAARARPLLERRESLAASLREALDTAVLSTAWGAEELRQLRLAYPRSALFELYEAKLATRLGRHDEAVAMYDRLVRAAPAAADLQLARAAALEAAGQRGDAADAYGRALELEPDSEPPFRALLALRESQGQLEALLRQIRRLRLASPASRSLADHEIEVLQRMGRLDEAASAARRRREALP